MTFNEAEAQAKANSLQYRSISYVIDLGDKQYSVVSEERYNARGLEDPVIVAFDKGEKV